MYPDNTVIQTFLRGEGSACEYILVLLCEGMFSLQVQLAECCEWEGKKDERSCSQKDLKKTVGEVS